MFLSVLFGMTMRLHAACMNLNAGLKNPGERGAV
jgi:hypothetical protein